MHRPIRLEIPNVRRRTALREAASRRRIALLAALLACAASASAAQTVVVDAFDSGRYNELGRHSADAHDPFAGRLFLTSQAYLSFDLPDVPRVTAATLRVHLGFYYGPDPVETFSVWDVSTDVEELGRSQTSRFDIAEDLRSGTLYAESSARSTDPPIVLDIPLNAAAVADLAAAAGEAFAVGIEATSLSSSTSIQEGLGFYDPFGRPTVHQLVLDISPNCFSVDAIDDAFSVINDGSTSSFDVLANEECNGDEPIQVVVGAGDLEPDRGGSATTDGATVQYTPAPGFVGFEEFRYTARDAGILGPVPTVDEDGAYVVVEVEADLAPAALDDEVLTPQATAVSIDVLANDDAGNEPSTIVLSTPPSHGSAIVEPDRSILYTPEAGFYGIDTLEYAITDANGDVVTASVTIGVRFVRGRVAIDLMPNDAENRLNLSGGQGAGFEVAILSEGELFDAPALVDPLTLKLGPREANIWGDAKIRDVDHDGDDDLLVKFLSNQTGIACGDTHVLMIGRTFDSQPIDGVDAVDTYKCPKARKRY